jgi:[ribosomal protein S5]-alanine N-acetyltransferase
LELTIRRAAESDIPAMHGVRMSVVENRLADAARVQPEHYRALLENEGRGWVATAGGRLLGFAIADLRSQSVWALFVNREAEGRGIGRRLHEVMVEWLFQCGAPAITLGTDAGTRAERFYRAAGWQDAGADARGEAQYEMTRARWISVREANGRAAALPALQTERLSLRWLTAADVPALFTIFSDPEVTRFWSSPPLTSEAAAAKLVDEIHAYFASGELYQWGVSRRSDDRVIGTCTLASISREHQRAEIGFALARSEWNRGYATEALRVLLRYAFDEIALQRIEADVDPRNNRSLKLLEALGFVREGYARERYHAAGEVSDSVLLGLLKCEYGSPARSS